MLSIAPSPVLTFEKVLRAFGTGGFTYAEVVAQLERLLAIGASPTAMLETLRRRERIEPFPEYAHVEVVRLLNAAIEKSANEAAVSGAEYGPDAAQDQSPDSGLVPARSASGERREDAREWEQSQRRAIDESSGDSIASNEAARTRGEEVLRESKRYQTELSVMRDTLAARDATIAQVLNSLAERDAQLAALQQHHAKLVPMLEARADAGTHLEADLRSAQARANALAADLATARAALQSEHNKGRGFDKAWAEGLAANEAARLRGDEALLEAKRYQNDARALREALAAREATIAQMKHSLAERDAQLAALQQEHAKIVPVLKARANAGAQLEADLPAARMRADAIALELKASKEAAALLSAQLTRSESGLNAARRELGAMKTKLNSQLELLRSWEWRRGFDQNMCRELDARAQAAELERASLQTERDDLRGQLMGLPASAAMVVPSVPGAGVGGHALSAPPVRPQGQRWTLIPRPLLVGAAIAVLAVAAWFLMQRASAPKEASVPTAAAAPAPGTVIRDCPTCPAMVVLPGGRFKQGSLRAQSGSSAFETPLHWVAIGASLSMSSNAVTVEDFQQFIADTDWDMRGCATYDGDWKHRPDNNWKNPGFSQTGTHPVTCVSWNDAKAYVRWLSTKTGHSYRLPSASEWEYAARAGGEAVQPWSADGSGACATANVADASAAQRYPGWAVFGCNDGYVYTAPVGSFKANSFGLNDMLGNVFQWTEDCWHPDYSGAPIDGSARRDGDCSEHELRGGSWFSTPAYVRANYRNHFAADYRTSSVGIRLVRDIGP
jgi:formylglycine-generating enzyme required for sulfatase activity